MSEPLAYPQFFYEPTLSDVETAVVFGPITRVNPTMIGWIVWRALTKAHRETSGK